VECKTILFSYIYSLIVRAYAGVETVQNSECNESLKLFVKSLHKNSLE